MSPRGGGEPHGGQRVGVVRGVCEEPGGAKDFTGKKPTHAASWGWSLLSALRCSRAQRPPFKAWQVRRWSQQPPARRSPGHFGLLLDPPVPGLHAVFLPGALGQPVWEASPWATLLPAGGRGHSLV